MQGFKGIMDNAAVGKMNLWANQYDGFHKFAKLLEKLAGGIQDGVIAIPKWILDLFRAIFNLIQV